MSLLDKDRPSMVPGSIMRVMQMKQSCTEQERVDWAPDKGFHIRRKSRWERLRDRLKEA